MLVIYYFWYVFRSVSLCICIFFLYVSDGFIDFRATSDSFFWSLCNCFFVVFWYVIVFFGTFLTCVSVFCIFKVLFFFLDLRVSDVFFRSVLMYFWCVSYFCTFLICASVFLYFSELYISDVFFWSVNKWCTFWFLSTYYFVCSFFSFVNLISDCETRDR